MDLTSRKVQRIITAARPLLGRAYSANFSCVDFVRAVYGEIGLRIPPLNGYRPPPVKLNIPRVGAVLNRVGHLIFLRRRHDPRDRYWTHVAIVWPKASCIHCSRFFGGQVVVTPLTEVFEKYDFVPS